ncbi:MAG: saccharopine dehydrogenase family protein [Deltaproteobacteria bacterium]|jgi:saccharopine dehydrogenase (NAD+, L-lysine-forming)|nr:saccharopine dehydrogenase family protein [Deltaproteobacteria bacterium]
MAKVLLIGAGGVGRVVAHKCAQVRHVFSEIVLASRTLARCEQIKKEVADKGLGPIEVRQVDADDVPALIALLREVKPQLVINVALPYQDLTIMEACLQTGVHYLDTANYEHPDTAHFEYKEQWALHDRFQEAGLMALLGSGFDPGVTNVFCAYAQQNLFDEIHYIDILDCNAGDHGYPFATNFNPEINIREITAKGRYWQEGTWLETEPLSVRIDHDYPEVGVKASYLLYHEELESLVKNIKGLKRIRFFMTFGDSYLTHLKVLQNVGLTRIDEVEHDGHKIVPLQFLKTLLPDPASLGPRTKGKTNIGCLIKGVKDGKPRQVYIYNICDHQECWAEVGSQAVSYTTGVPAMIGAVMMLQSKWQGQGVFNMEEFEAAPFMDALNKHGLPWTVLEMAVDEG